MITIAIVTDDADRITTVSQLLTDIPADQANNLERIFHQMELTEDSKIVLIDEENDAEEFEDIATTLKIMTDTGSIEDEDDLVDLDWEKIDTVKENSVAFLKNGIAYSYFNGENAGDWFPAFLVLVV